MRRLTQPAWEAELDGATVNAAWAWLLENMTEDEANGRASFRPHIAEAWRELCTLEQNLPLLWGGDQA